MKEPKATGVNQGVHVVAADVMRGDIIVHFSDGTTTLFHGPFLFDVRSHDGNLRVSEGPDDELGEVAIEK